jgi:hypothetical protein|tara:strand:+ start:143 stop:667 length:525 start_codon:yes stop_codon:yes gene_type:complete
MIIKELQLRNYSYKNRKGLSESLVRRYFEKKGYEVFRGRQVLGKQFSKRYKELEAVKKRYTRLETLLKEQLGKDLLKFRKAIFKLSGIPDFFLHKAGYCFFVEVKLEHEQIKNHQLQCMKALELFNLPCYIYRIKSKPYRILSEIRLEGSLEENKKLKNRKILVKQEKIKQSWR